MILLNTSKTRVYCPEMVFVETVGSAKLPLIRLTAGRIHPKFFATGSQGASGHTETPVRMRGFF
jgi:hypothetical protein